MNKWVKYGLVGAAIVVGVLLVTKKNEAITDETDKDFEDLVKRIENAKK